MCTEYIDQSYKQGNTAGTLLQIREIKMLEINGDIMKGKYDVLHRVRL